MTTDYQTHFRLRESQGRSFAEDLNEKVMLWSLGESLMILVIGIRCVHVRLYLEHWRKLEVKLSGSFKLLVADTQFYKRLCLSVRPYVRGEQVKKCENTQF